MLTRGLAILALVLVPVVAAVAADSPTIITRPMALGCQVLPCGMSPNQSSALGRPLCPLSPDHERSLSGGTVTLANQPSVLEHGSARLLLAVDRLSWAADPSAKVSGFLYPVGQTDQGRGVTFRSLGDGQFVGGAWIGNGCPYELAVRVWRPGMPSELTYIRLPIAQ
jgi:hypothetical protein